MSSCNAQPVATNGGFYNIGNNGMYLVPDGTKGVKLGTSAATWTYAQNLSGGQGGLGLSTCISGKMYHLTTPTAGSLPSLTADGTQAGGWLLAPDGLAVNISTGINYLVNINGALSLVPYSSPQCTPLSTLKYVSTSDPGSCTDKKKQMWIIIGGIAGGFVLLLIVAAILSRKKKVTK